MNQTNTQQEKVVQVKPEQRKEDVQYQSNILNSLALKLALPEISWEILLRNRVWYLEVQALQYMFPPLVCH